MIRFYSMFVTDDKLLASPYVRRFNVFHDITLHRGVKETINFLLQRPLTPQEAEKLRVIYDPHTISLEKIEVHPYKHQSLLTVTLTPKEIGSVKIGFAVPNTKSLHESRLNKLNSPLTTVSCRKLNEKSGTSCLVV